MGVGFGHPDDGEPLRLPCSYEEPSITSTREGIRDVVVEDVEELIDDITEYREIA